MKSSFIILGVLPLLLLEPANGAQCTERKYEESLCGDSGDVECSYSFYRKYVRSNDSYTEFSRGCGQDTKENCKQLADEKSCQDSAQCMWLGTRKASDPPYVYREAGCQEFDCAFGWGKNMCDQFKECSWDLEHKVCKTTRQTKKGLWDRLKDYLRGKSN
ncbi:hypothetical protein O0I10_009751 [Lichtheimia ornata]|uniref:Uncharacterized protein n=1 Tax=Lichtheimia ornata TaxID=688661 RepID=A0AAD7UXB1_9FUNG|nr:uncharacterized protein O0I10_009751 [Lichtheimia ornata]KAJ8654569.1 hypothetical protein O0I10_009751 [Lichtheimia ornata]